MTDLISEICFAPSFPDISSSSIALSGGSPHVISEKVVAQFCGNPSTSTVTVMHSFGWMTSILFVPCPDTIFPLEADHVNFNPTAKSLLSSTTEYFANPPGATTLPGPTILKTGQDTRSWAFSDQPAARKIRIRNRAFFTFSIDQRTEQEVGGNATVKERAIFHYRVGTLVHTRVSALFRILADYRIQLLRGCFGPV